MCGINVGRLGRLFGAALLSATLAVLAACGDPCRELALKVCDCPATAELRKQCSDRVAALSGQQGNSDAAAAQRCAGLLKGCSCAALRAGNLQACGLSTEPALH